MRTGRSEALDMFRKWFSEKPIVRCDLVFGRLRSSLRGRIASLSEMELRLVSDDKRSEFALLIGPDLEFGYGEPRPPIPGEEPTECALIVFLPTWKSPQDHECIVFMELPNPT